MSTAMLEERNSSKSHAAAFGGASAWMELIEFEGPMTARSLAARSGAHERYIQMWLDDQVLEGNLIAYSVLDGSREVRYESMAGTSQARMTALRF